MHEVMAVASILGHHLTSVHVVVIGLVDLLRQRHLAALKPLDANFWLS